MPVLLVLFGIVGLLFVSAALRGYVLSTIWGWFIVPAFGAPEISIPVACGISLIVAMLVATPNPKEGYGADEIGRAAAHVIIGPLLMLGIGRIILAFM